MSRARNWQAAPWTEAEPLECVRVVPETAETVTFTFRAPSGAWFDYQPGQFLTLDLPVPGGNVQRSYTLSSSPSRPLSVSVTVKVQPASVGSRWMADSLRPGMRLRAWGPSGVFSSHRHPSQKYLFISAGSGATPMISMATWAWDMGVQTDIVFVHAARRPSDILFRQRLDLMAGQMPGLQLRYTVSRPDPHQAWPGYTGRLTPVMLGLMAPDYPDREVFCCGPDAFMASVREMLQALGYDMGRYHQESFAPPGIGTGVPVDITPAADAAAEVVFADSGVTQPCAQTETILAVARQAGLNIPSGCTFGLCGTCRIRKVSGQVHMVHSGGISDEDVADGYILACCSKPLGRVEVSV